MSYPCIAVATSKIDVIGNDEPIQQLLTGQKNT
jgi:hypothetical protein